tara:strand:+ start:373 stop:549 length:177 start_codon:yes stop_codon:yes gene_type:complete
MIRRSSGPSIKDLIIGDMTEHQGQKKNPAKPGFKHLIYISKPNRIGYQGWNRSGTLWD